MSKNQKQDIAISAFLRRFRKLTLLLFCFALIDGNLSGEAREGESALYYNIGLNESELPPSQSLNLTESMTLESWIKPDGWGEGPNYLATIIHKPSIWLFIIYNHDTANNRSLILQLRHGGGISRTYSEVGSIVLDVWSHIAVSYSAADNEVKMLINGNLQNVAHISSPSGPIRNNATEGFHLGSIQGSSMGFMGVLDEVRIWDAVRTESEIIQNMSTTLTGDESGLQLYWPMNEGGGDSLHDMSGNGHDIRISGMDWASGTPFHPTSITDPMPTEVLPELILSTYPNPFNPELTIRTELSVPADLHIHIYNSVGQEVWSRLQTNQPAGQSSIMWNGVDKVGTPVASGIYIISAATPDHIISKKNVLLR